MGISTITFEGKRVSTDKELKYYQYCLVFIPKEHELHGVWHKQIEFNDNTEMNKVLCYEMTDIKLSTLKKHVIQSKFAKQTHLETVLN